LADKLKGIAIDKGKSVYFRALPPKDRKLIHQYLAEDGRVKSRSVGEGHFKKIKIYPNREKDRQEDQSATQ
jgi:spoIIIJ-associated protein